MKLKPTKEQVDIIEHRFSKAEVLKITAFAGTGKTTTLRLLSERIQEGEASAKILYLAFNKSVQTQAKKEFPPNVDAKTIHGLAYATIGKNYKHKLVPKIRPMQILKELNEDRKNVGVIKAAIDSLNQYFVSKDMSFSEKHVCMNDGLVGAGSSEIMYYVNKIWSIMKDPNDESIGMLHDGYLKLFQAQIENEGLGYDYIFLDEAQDSNPITTEIVMANKDSIRVLVGDPHQQIYSFRGAKNAMKEVQSDSHFYLRNSFRFGTNIAAIANLLLLYYKKETEHLIGKNGRGKIGYVDIHKPFAILGRTNSGLFAEAINWYKKKKIAYIGGAEAMRVDLLKSAHQFYQGKSVNDQYLKTFTSFSDLEKYGEDYEDIEVKSLTRLVKKYEENLEELLDDIASDLVSPEKAEVILCTAHKAKGLEFDQVKLLDDYIDFFDKKGVLLHPRYHDADEINLMYVAVTRAKEVLECNEDLLKVISEIQKQSKTGVA